MANPNQLFLLADHIKLSLLERQRAISLNLSPNSQDGHISRSLDSFREGIEGITNEVLRLQETGDEAAAATLNSTKTNLLSQYADLSSQFSGNTPSSPTLSKPNNPSLASDFARASERPTAHTTNSSLKKTKSTRSSNDPSKSVRFQDSPSSSAAADQDEDPNRSALFPTTYRDDPIDGPPDQSHLDNQQIHAYHSRVIAEQDEQLDRLGESIGRQRELSIQIGDELDSQVAMLDEVDGLVDRHTTRLDQAKKALGGLSRKAVKNGQITTIVVLIIILVLLIVILK